MRKPTSTGAAVARIAIAFLIATLALLPLFSIRLAHGPLGWLNLVLIPFSWPVLFAADLEKWMGSLAWLAAAAAVYLNSYLIVACAWRIVSDVRRNRLAARSGA